MQLRMIKDSIHVGIVALTAIETAGAVAGFSLLECLPESTWWQRLAALLLLFVAVTGICFLAKYFRYRRGWHVKINLGLCEVAIKRGDLFEQDGWKVIPCTESYDMRVGDGIISRSSINGQFIEKCTGDGSELKSVIANDESSTVGKLPPTKGRARYGLGTVKTFLGEYALLAFSRFNKHNEAHITMPEYEDCLMKMWRELNRVYDGRSINLPLIGDGITRFDGCRKPAKDDLLRCMLCTLRAMGLSFNAPITVVLTNDALAHVHLYQLKAALESRA